MSKYHPLDVRHPRNRAAERRDYLLAPPAPRDAPPATAPARPSATPAAAPATSGPWGQRGAARDDIAARLSRGTRAAARRAGTGARGDTRPRRMPTGLIFALIFGGVVLANNPQIVTQALNALRRWAWDLGITLPF